VDVSDVIFIRMCAVQNLVLMPFFTDISCEYVTFVDPRLQANI
jgi:hypothetical protein